MFICNHCPFVKHLKKDIAKLTSFYMGVCEFLYCNMKQYLINIYWQLFFLFMQAEGTWCCCNLFKFCHYTSTGTDQYIICFNCYKWLLQDGIKPCFLHSKQDYVMPFTDKHLVDSTYFNIYLLNFIQHFFFYVKLLFISNRMDLNLWHKMRSYLTILSLTCLMR